MVLPESMRLKGHKCFDYLHRSGIRYHGSLMVLRVVKAKPILIKSNQKKGIFRSCRCAVSISSKVSKKAVIRNRLRRLIHNHLRIRLLNVTEHCERWALISLKPSSSMKEIAPLLEECDRLLHKAGLFL